MTYMTVQQAAEAWGLSVRQVQVYCNRGRVPGAQKFGIAWQIPEGTPKPEDARYKTAHTQRENSSLGDHSPRMVGDYLMPLMNTAFKPGQCRSVEVKGGNLQASGTTNGIHFLSNANDATAVANLKVSGNAMVKASNISTTKDGTGSVPELKPAASGSDGTGGIIWDGKNGTVYGSVTLDENLTIGEGESLTIPEGASLNTNGNTITVENGGKLEGTPTGTVVYAPTITTESLPDGEVGTAYNQPLTATGDAPITWTVSGTLPDGLSLDADTGAITGTPTTAGSSTFTVKAENSAGFTTNQYTLNIKPATVSVTGVKLDKTELPLVVGGNATLIATVEPDTATDKSVTWESSDPNVATVEDGTVTAVKEGEAAIIVKTVDGGYTATCTVKVTQATYSISADISPDFGSVYTGYDRPTAKTVTITNTGNQTLTLERPASTKSFEVGTLSKTPLAPGEKATFTVQPKADLAVGSYEETINISGSNGNNKVSTSVDATFAVVDINDTSVDNKLTVTSGISAGISGTAFDNADKVKAELTRVLVQDAAYTAGNTAFYDVRLQYSLNGGQTWFEATEATFPTEGITVTLPYPSGTGKDTHNFRVVHMFTVTSTRLGTTAGNTETPAVTKTDSGLQVTLNGLSPVVIGWDKIETPSSGGSTTPAATATPAPSDNITYYTCPSCGYHNWTATDAGYRCDNCGYLESTKQLSGYGNVKGTYTPGSGATSTAASTVPQTGDESNPVLWTVLLLVSGLALGGLAIAKRKKQQ